MCSIFNIPDEAVELIHWVELLFHERNMERKKSCMRESTHRIIFFYYLKIKLLVLLQPLSWLLWSHSEHDICQFLCFSLSLTFYEREILNNNRCSYSSSLGQLSIFIIVQKLHLECLNRPQQTLTLILLLKALFPVQH